mgnify:CR=1 FL=1
MAIWNPWRGCHRYSEGCKYCYIHKGDARRGVVTDEITKTEKFDWPMQKNRKGEYWVKAGQTVYLCFSSDFFVEDTDPWRQDCSAMMRQRDELHFLFLTQRNDRFWQCIRLDFGDGYENVTIG